MIDRIIAELIDNMVGANIISKEAKDAYIYAYTIVIERILTLITIGIAGIVLHRFVYIVVFICTFMMLRRRTGGFHLETFGQCFIGTNLICFIIEISDFIWSKYMLIVSFICIVSVIYIVCIGTINHPNLAMNNTELKHSRKRARIVVVLETLLLMVIYIAGADRMITGYMVMGINVCALLLFMSRIQSRMNGGK